MYKLFRNCPELFAQTVLLFGCVFFWGGGGLPFMRFWATANGGAQRIMPFWGRGGCTNGGKCILGPKPFLGKGLSGLFSPPTLFATLQINIVNVVP